VSAPVRQAVVIVHGMGEQRPQETLHRFIRAALVPRADGKDYYYSEPDRVSESFESRLYRATREPTHGEPEVHAQTDFYEYHWAHLMQGNRLGDLGPMFRRMLLRPVWRVPLGLRVPWVAFWGVGLFLAWAFAFGPLHHTPFGDDPVTTVIQALLGTGVVSTLVAYAVAKWLPGALTVSFVDVVRYLDTSPRSYAVRRDIRKGMVDLLKGLHEVGNDGKDWRRYDRIVVVAHSLGAYIAYDAIAYLWSQCGDLLGGQPAVPEGSPALDELERLASALPTNPTPAQIEEFQAAQRALWSQLRAHASPWLIADFVSVGTPMYCADLLYTKSRSQWNERVQLRELPTCPPQADLGDSDKDGQLRFAYPSGRRRIVYHAAPFAAVRWTNLWFPPRFGVLGDWFGGPLAPLFGAGVRDIPVTGGALRWAPAIAHTKYFSYPDDLRSDSATTHLRAALDLASTVWIHPPGAPDASDATTVIASAPPRKRTPRKRTPRKQPSGKQPRPK
jgi:hypothetical protein